METSEKSTVNEERILIRERTLSLIKLVDGYSIWFPAIRNIGTQFPNPSSSRSVFAEWWKTHGKYWINRFQEIMVEHSNLEHNWDFSTAQVENLKKYYFANEYVLGLLDNVQNISSSMRSKIKKTMLLPLTDVQRFENLLIE